MATILPAQPVAAVAAGLLGVERPLGELEHNLLMRIGRPRRNSAMWMSSAGMAFSVLGIVGLPLGIMPFFLMLIFSLTGLLAGALSYGERKVAAAMMTRGTAFDVTGVPVRLAAGGMQMVAVGGLSFALPGSADTGAVQDGRTNTATAVQHEKPGGKILTYVLGMNGTVFREPNLVRTATRISPVIALAPAHVAAIPAAPPCPTCGRPARVVVDYAKWYCDSCARYPWG